MVDFRLLVELVLVEGTLGLEVRLPVDWDALEGGGGGGGWDWARTGALFDAGM